MIFGSVRGEKQLKPYLLNVLLVKNLKVRRYLVLNRQIFRNFAWISILHFVIREWILLVLFKSKIYGKNDQMFKSYICLFTCATTRSVNLELTPSMNVSDLIKALVRFLSRRGCINNF